MRKIGYFAGIAIIVCLAAIIILTGIQCSVIPTLASQKPLPIYSVDTAEKTVAITFDCAWGASDIPKILDTLKNEKVKASFFLVGQWAEKYPDETRLIAKEGHNLANHSQNHFHMPHLNESKLALEITQCNDTIKKITGITPKLFRPPYGAYDSKTIRIAEGLHMF
jgi:peptidoglycan/xylan/chitin deacetylase (PgdA/CDA1 family)